MLTNSRNMVSAYLEPVYRFSWNSVWTLPLECSTNSVFLIPYSRWWQYGGCVDLQNWHVTTVPQLYH